MKKRFLAVGDSHTYGDELKDIKDAWPYKLAQLIGYDVDNRGVPGSSNPAIHNRVIRAVSEQHYDLVVIGWSFPGRISWKDEENHEWHVWPGYPPEHLDKHGFSHRRALLRYITENHDPAYLYELSLINYITLQEYLKARGINYLMINSWNKEYYRNTFGKKFPNLSSQIDQRYFIGWDTFGMREHVDKHKCPIGPGHHFLEEGHVKVAELFNEHIRNFGWVS